MQKNKFSIPLLNLDHQHTPIHSELMSAIEDVVKSNHYILGPYVEELEGKISHYVNSKYGIGVSSGSDALLMCLMALDCGPGDLVLTSDYSFFATAGAVSRLGATPVFIDIEPTTYNIDPDALKVWFDENPGKIDKVKAIIPVHLYGQSADLKPIMDLADQYDIPVIEDAAQAIGTTYPMNGSVQKIGSIGKMACFSFFPSKNLGCFGDGGMITTNDDQLYEKMTIIRNHGSNPKYYHKMIGGNFRLDAIQAAVLLVKFKYLELWHAERRTNALFYDENLNADWIKKPLARYGLEHHIYNQYIISVDEDRDVFRKYLKDYSIATEVYYPVPFHKQECFANLNYPEDAFQNSAYAANHTLALPVYPGLTEEDKAYVVDVILEYSNV